LLVSGLGMALACPHSYRQHVWSPPARAHARARAHTHTHTHTHARTHTHTRTHTGYVKTDWDNMSKDFEGWLDANGDGKVDGEDMKVLWSRFSAIAGCVRKFHSHAT
jgi:hypothetical protein